MKLFQRASSPMPDWWQKVRNTAIAVAVVGGCLLAAPITLPAAIATALTVLTTVAGSIAGTAQLTQKGEE
jgi:hypothetical protein